MATKLDAVPYIINETTNKPHDLDPILNKLSADDYRSIFFLLLDIIEQKDYLFLVWKEKRYLKNKFLDVYYKFPFKKALLIEIFGTMQKYELLKVLGTCQHIFQKDKETFTQISPLWKSLYTICEQLTDGEVEYLKEKLFPDNSALNICCAEELFCLAFVKDIFQENNWQSKLVELLKDFRPDYCKLITSFKGTKLNYYPLIRPTKAAPCGKAVIINHVTFHSSFLEERSGSNADAEALEKLWESYGFTTTTHTDLDDEQVFEVFKELSKENHSNYDAFIACYLSHGDEGIVYASNGKAIKLLDLLDIIANQCETLVGKPKLFFIQACQGHRIQTGFGGYALPIRPECETKEKVSRLAKNNALRSDVLMFSSTIEGYASFRQGGSSWFIGALVATMQEFGEDLTIASILTKVEKKVTEKEGAILDNSTKCKQTPVIYNTLRMELKLKKCF
ncbi:caspase-3 [Caerostris extrusa]|uniref:Caspase-3 n=1 Tax=Caerostris extrusa TaxID=172846 RepID=A0AAV4YBX5_CAEEX|nr:caspase-3 [Caerostris extrusa]